MEAKNKAVLTKPQIARLKQLTDNLDVGLVLGDRVLVKLVESYTEMDRVEKEGILVLPETVKEANQPLPTVGVVVGVGTGVNLNMCPVGAGDMIMFSKFAGSDCYFNEEAFRIMDTREILCTLQERSAAVPSVMPVV